MSFIRHPAPHLNRAKSVTQIMREVVWALVPAALIHVYFFGPGVLINFTVAAFFALLSEYVMLRLRRQPVTLFLADFSAIVTAALLAFALPPITPWWVTACASIFAIVVAKQLYGGLGFNTFNPAMAGYAMVLVSFPTELSLWTAPLVNHPEIQSLTWIQMIAATFTGQLPDALNWDQITQATPLDQVAIGLTQGQMLSELIGSSTLSSYGANHWLLINGAILAGGLWLLYRRIITWHIPVALLLSLCVIATFFRLYDADSFSSPMFHLFSGSALIGAFFIATDPVSAATSNSGRIVYAACIGALVYIIRTWGSYPDGVAFAVLLVNMFVPLIDYFFVPRTYGHES